MSELLIPRFQLIADYPANNREIGSISKEGAAASYFRKFPAVFKELEWFEKRTIDEMPQYLKDKVTGKVKRVYKHFTYILIDGSMSGEHEAEAVCSFDEIAPSGFEKLFWRYDCCLPSNEKEFLEQQPVSER